jgi:hypothetical protein
MTASHTYRSQLLDRLFVMAARNPASSALIARQHVLASRSNVMGLPVVSELKLGQGMVTEIKFVAAWQISCGVRLSQRNGTRRGR